MESEETSRTAGKGSALKALVSFFTLWHMDIDQDDMDDMERKFHLVPFVALFFSVFIIIEMLIMQWLSKNYGFGSDLFAAVSSLQPSSSEASSSTSTGSPTSATA